MRYFEIQYRLKGSVDSFQPLYDEIKLKPALLFGVTAERFIELEIEHIEERLLSLFPKFEIIFVEVIKEYRLIKTFQK